uniref:Uncharacterized protein n=1 Tax=Anguilla anguilla TaxID=7936 RepID=A0A0E9V1F8_ANGAN
METYTECKNGNHIRISPQKIRTKRLPQEESNLIRKGPVWVQILALAQHYDTSFNRLTNRGLQSNTSISTIRFLSFGLKQKPALFRLDWIPLVLSQ